jgi:hypothetical protein
MAQNGDGLAPTLGSQMKCVAMTFLFPSIASDDGTSTFASNATANFRALAHFVALPPAWPAVVLSTTDVITSASD